jgi:poly(3-hydroxybutyrate) depolymerase
MHRSRATILFLLAAMALAGAVEAKITKETFQSAGVTRTYYLFVPEDVEVGATLPLVILLHGSGRDGKSLITYWENLARSERIIVAGPDSTVREGWGPREDGPHFLYELVELLKSKHPVDPRRVYLFGHSAGAIHALSMGVLESEYFAAIAAHAGVIDEPYKPFVERAPRKIPLGIWVGTRDALFPVPAVRATRDLFQAAGFEVLLTEIPGHTHRYYDRGAAINRQVWAFLKDKALADDPKYQEYEITK